MSATPLKIQFGCGGNILEGWHNHDADMDVSRPLPYPDECAELVFSEHLNEHLTGPELLGFLDECYRILLPGGTIRWCGPAVTMLLDRHHARDLTVNHGHKQVLNGTTMETFLWMAGFDDVRYTSRQPCDGHWRVIGAELDDLETVRLEAKKPLNAGGEP